MILYSSSFPPSARAGSYRDYTVRAGTMDWALLYYEGLLLAVCSLQGLCSAADADVSSSVDSLDTSHSPTHPPSSPPLPSLPPSPSLPSPSRSPINPPVSSPSSPPLPSDVPPLSTEEQPLLPEVPVQLIHPDPNHHRHLEVISSNVRLLHNIRTAVAVVAVVGKFHSGKSFLLNQLMGKQEGFGVGPSVRPHTMGIWMWGKPMMAKLPSGEPLSVIFLDTEGFAASNISETYDAKIFSVATLLSSYLIYNSVKIIDQGDIDYLELLARRTQLFALRSQMTKSKWFEEFNHDLLRFPPLVWVVQDFVQQTADEETPTEWLHHIMETNSREEGDYDINLLGIFDTVDCHTLFLPATKKHLLQDLSKATEEDLTPEYKEERDRLTDKLKNGLVPKEKNGRPITGPELATLLDILVTAANEGSLAEIPGRWQVFIDQLQSSALEDCAAFYESDIHLLLKSYENSAVNETELLEWHYSSVEKATTLLKQLLFGLEEAIMEAVNGLNSSAAEKFEKIWDLNEKKIMLKCGEVQRQLELEAEEKLQGLVLPMKSHDLVREEDVVRQACIASYHDLVGHLRDNAAFERQLSQLQTGLRYIFGGVTLKNNEAMEELLQSSIELALEKFREGCTNQNRLPRTTSAFQTTVKAASSRATGVFEESSVFAHGERLYQPFLSLLKTRIDEEITVFRKENSELIKASCQAQARELVAEFRHSTGSTKLPLPLKDSELDSRLSEGKTRAVQVFEQTQSAFDDTTAFDEAKEELSADLESVCSQRRDENYQAYIKEVEVPLGMAKKLILLSADKYDTPFSISHYMKQVCLLNLDEGKAKNWDSPLKEKIVERFIHDSHELQAIVKSKEGYWSSVKGFFQWLYWLLFGDTGS